VEIFFATWPKFLCSVSNGWGEEGARGE
jgi:hypothetical protein